jgi:hypothetical protein
MNYTPEKYSKSNWTGRTSRTLQEAFGPYEAGVVQGTPEKANWWPYAALVLVSVGAVVVQVLLA